jgi:hypothetical protein
MAERRMFAKAIINSARFLRMPSTSRLLYYDLGMSADDDGIVEAFTVMRLTGAQEDDLRVLVSKGYVTILNEDLVSVINDWKTNNTIRGDRYRPSIYKDLLVKLPSDNQAATACLPSDNQVTDTRVTQDRIDKVRSGKDNNNERFKKQIEADFEEIWAMYPNKKGKPAALKAYKKAIKNGDTHETIKSGLIKYIEYVKALGLETRYIKHGSTWFNQECWNDDYDVKEACGNGGNIDPSRQYWDENDPTVI